jgi:hypothetical protein
MLGDSIIHAVNQWGHLGTATDGTEPCGDPEGGTEYPQRQNKA